MPAVSSPYDSEAFWCVSMLDLIYVKYSGFTVQFDRLSFDLAVVFMCDITV